MNLYRMYYWIFFFGFLVDVDVGATRGRKNYDEKEDMKLSLMMSKETTESTDYNFIKKSNMMSSTRKRKRNNIKDSRGTKLDEKNKYRKKMSSMGDHRLQTK